MLKTHLAHAARRLQIMEDPKLDSLAVGIGRNLDDDHGYTRHLIILERAVHFDNHLVGFVPMLGELFKTPTLSVGEQAKGIDDLIDARGDHACSAYVLKVDRHRYLREGEADLALGAQTIGRKGSAWRFDRTDADEVQLPCADSAILDGSSA